MTREQLIESAKAKASAMGWEAIAEDQGGIVEMLLAAKGASDQKVTAPLSRLGAELSALGVPSDYPAIEEYDLEADVIPEPSPVKQDGSWTEEAERLSPGELPAGPDGEGSPDIEPPSEEAEKEKEMFSMKDVYRSLTGQVSDQDQGGIPRPKAKELGLHEDPEPAFGRPVNNKEATVKKATVRTSSVFYVKGLKNGKPFCSGKYRFVEKARNGARGAVKAGLKEVRVVPA